MKTMPMMQRARFDSAANALTERLRSKATRDEAERLASHFSFVTDFDPEFAAFLWRSCGADDPTTMLSMSAVADLRREFDQRKNDRVRSNEISSSATRQDATTTEVVMRFDGNGKRSAVEVAREKRDEAYARAHAGIIGDEQRTDARVDSRARSVEEVIAERDRRYALAWKETA